MLWVGKVEMHLVTNSGLHYSATTEVQERTHPSKTFVVKDGMPPSL